MNNNEIRHSEQNTGETRRSFLRKASILGVGGLAGTIGGSSLLCRETAAAPSGEILRFACISDTHLGHGKALQKTARALKVLTAKTPLDKLFVIGDITNMARESEYDQVLAVFSDPANLSGSIPVRYITGNHDYADRKDSLSRYTRRTGQENDEYVEIKGYPFISAGMTGSSTPTVYNDTTRGFLRQSLADAAAKYAGKPIFVFAHIPAPNTCYGSRHWHAAKHLDGIFDKYPQVILFTGHSHSPVSHQASIWQGTFTAVNDGHITNTDDISVDKEDGVTTSDGKLTDTPGRYEEVSEGILVSVLANGNVEIQRWDVLRDVEIFPRWLVSAPHDGSRFAYRPDSPKPSAPEFDASVLPSVKTGGGIVTVVIPQAQPSLSVLRYQVNVFRGKPEQAGSGAVLKEMKDIKDAPAASSGPFSFYYLTADQPKTVEAVFKNLPSGEPLYVCITAIDHFGTPSKRAWCLEAT
ncbi:MAG: metallophosphoesterase [Planctomycetaceae bacterium]|jgi:predicted MPP superfamily phosphohydrolase|nr:metallophosphoesterase [Planctomycetaceae bacterium]